jgi:hypothetical protein
MSEYLHSLPLLMQARQVGRARSHCISAVSGPGDGVSYLVTTYFCLAVDTLTAREGRLVALLLLFGRRVIVFTVVEVEVEVVGLRHCGYRNWLAMRRDLWVGICRICDSRWDSPCGNKCELLCSFDLVLSDSACGGERNYTSALAQITPSKSPRANHARSGNSNRQFTRTCCGESEAPQHVAGGILSQARGATDLPID